MEDKLLVYRCKCGSQEALTQIYRKYKADLLLLAMALLNDRSACEDVVHDVFVSFVQGLDGFRLTGSLKGFLLTCVANHARNWNKAQRRRSRAGTDADTGKPACADSPTEAVACNEQIGRLSGAMAGLPFEQREVVMLHLHGAMTFAAIARARQISTNTAKSRYRYGIDRLRYLLNGEATR
ncbi:MAG: sigma-70 family RNA polymerase sigma factor [Sedimentisphaerales bacterium]|jgi:RNA polymerase sigma-70 factor (ECF subfamily)|nr:sigma-70 family RNA polymerase sigma factor [Sedimentisphaerales bacterium]NLT75983.1 sigma-70 family RNA polymerase sigma factor [Planctomycetota bacterium]